MVYRKMPYTIFTVMWGVGNRTEDNTSHFKYGKKSRSVKDKDRSKDLILNH